MKAIFTLFQIFYVVAAGTSQQRFDIQFMLDGRMRECIIVRPGTPPPPGGYPVVFMLHGNGGNGEEFYQRSGWKELGEEENFVTVFPSSLSWCYMEDGIAKRSERWVAGDLKETPCPGPPQIYVDDVKFLKVLARGIADSFAVNESMIFASGFSNGSVMIHKLAMEAGDIFAAVAGSSGTLTPQDSTTPVYRIPAWMMLGTMDDRFFVPPLTALPYGGDSILAYMNKPIRRALTCQGLTENYVRTETPIGKTYEFSEGRPGESSQPYLFSIINGMGHQYPNGSNFRLDAPKIFWDFFKRSVVAADHETALGMKLKAWPNPSVESIRIELPENNYRAMLYELFDLAGRSVLTGRVGSHDGFSIYKSQCGAGLFILRVTDGPALWQTSLIFN